MEYFIINIWSANRHDWREWANYLPDNKTGTILWEKKWNQLIFLKNNNKKDLKSRFFI